MSEDKVHLELFKLLDIETEEKRRKYAVNYASVNKDEKKQEINFIRTGNDTLAFGEISDAKLESDS